MSSKKILVVDDSPEELGDICGKVRDTYNVELFCVSSGEEARVVLEGQEGIDLAIIDLTLPGEMGVSVGSDLIAIHPELVIIYMRNRPPEIEDDFEIQRQGFSFIHKEPAKINQCIKSLFNPDWSIDNDTGFQSGDVLRDLGMVAFANAPVHEIITNLLKQLTEVTGISHAFLIDINTISKTVRIDFHYPPLEQDFVQELDDGLYFSPVSHVVRNEMTYYAAHIDQKRDRQFENFFPLLDYYACICTPILIPGMITRYVLVSLADRTGVLSQEDQDKTALTTRMLQVALERATILNYMRRFEQRYTTGRLLNSLVHEIKNKLDGIGMPLATLSAVLEKVVAVSEFAETAAFIDQAHSLTDDITQTKETMTDLLQAYSRMAYSQLEAVDVNVVVNKVQRQMDKRASDEGIKILIEEMDGRHPVWAIQTSLEQVITNLVLNAIQQIGLQRQRMRQVAREKNWKLPLLQNNVIVIRIWHDDTDPLPVKIAVFDTGPGINRDRHENIFLLDTSERVEGHGLGLYISHGLIETMGGRLRLVDSLMFIGSMFMVELRSPPEHGGENV